MVKVHFNLPSNCSPVTGPEHCPLLFSGFVYAEVQQLAAHTAQVIFVYRDCFFSLPYCKVSTLENRHMSGYCWYCGIAFEKVGVQLA